MHARTPRFQSRICLEVTAGQGNCLGWRFEHLAEVLSQTKDAGRLGICLDTCHLFAAGYDLSTEAGYHEVMASATGGGTGAGALHPPQRQQEAAGCRVDRHEEVGKGAIGLTPFRCLMKDARFVNTIGILETPFPERYAQAIRLLESLGRRK